MKYPKFLHKSGVIGFVAPSFGCETEPYMSAFNSALEQLEQRGFHLDKGPNCYAGEGIGISNTPEKCGREFQEYYLKKDNDCLISCGGGELMCEILDYVDFEKIKEAEPKWFMGYSDNTHLNFLLPTLCDTAAVYGPCAGAFGMKPWHSSVEDALQLLMGEKLAMTGYELWEKEGGKEQDDPLEPYNCTEKSHRLTFIPDGKGGLSRGTKAAFEGRLLGGCLDCLVNLLGTKYDRVQDFNERYKKDGIIWFLEACDLNVFGIRRALWQMEHAGWFQHVKGFLIGRPAHFNEEIEGLDQYEAVLSTVRKYQAPVIMDVDLGHLPPMIPLITGSFAGVSIKNENFAVKMELK